MKTIIIYHSFHHGNTKRIAEAIGEEIGADLFDIKDINGVDFCDYDTVGMGSGIYKGNYSEGILSLIEKTYLEGRDVFLFSTSGNANSFFNSFNNRVGKKLKEKGANLIGVFNCPGLDTYGPFKWIGGLNKGKPNEEDVLKARKFAKDLKL
jgi:flavodoxin